VFAYFFSDKINTSSLDALENIHGTVRFTHPHPWLLHEAFAQSKWHVSDKVKSILSGDPIDVHIKNGPQFETRFFGPILWGANTNPQFKESTKALANRIIVQPCSRVFDEDKPIGVAKEARKHGLNSPSEFVLQNEKSGMLNWMLEGLRRIQKRGHFVLTGVQKDLLHTMHIESNYVVGFNEECIDFDVSSKVSNNDYNLAHAMWWEQNGTREIPSNEKVARALRDLYDGRLSFSKSGPTRFVCGIKLNDIGMAFWESGSHNLNDSKTLNGKRSGISANPQDVNRKRGTVGD
jgi:hypothetical protein